MKKEYTDLNSLLQDYPEATQSIIDENEGQYPNAKFVRAAVGLNQYCVDDGDTDPHLMAFFDVGNPDTLLWAWVPGVGKDPFLDEYYEIPANEIDLYLGDLI